MADSSKWKEDIIQSKLGGKTEWNSQERFELCHSLDQEFEKNLKNSVAKSGKNADMWTEDNWKQKMGEHPIFAPFLPESEVVDGMAPINDLSEGLAQLKYDPEHNTIEEVTLSYKEEGLFFFKLKKYRSAIASFSKALEQKCINLELVAQLYNNRAASHFFISNYRSSINDCEASVKIDSNYMKPIIRAIACCQKLERHEEGISWVDRGLQFDSANQMLLEKRSKFVKSQKEKLRNTRKQKQETDEQKGEKLLSIVLSHGCTIYQDQNDDRPLSLDHLEPCYLQARGNGVHLDDSGNIIWPIMFLYPEYGESDFIQEAHENSKLVDHLTAIFGRNCERAPWDKEHKYVDENLLVAYEHMESNSSVVLIDVNQTLLHTLADKRFRIKAGTPSFIVLPKNSAFTRSFIAEYK